MRDDLIHVTGSMELLGNCKQWLPRLYNQADLVITSPPYWNQRECAADGNAGADYKSFKDYEDDMKVILQMCIEASRPGAIFAVNIGGDPEIDLSAWLSMMMHNLGLKFIDKIAWTKQSGNVIRGMHIESRNNYYPFLAWEPVYIYRKPAWTGSREVEFPAFEDRFKEMISQVIRQNVWHIPMDGEARWHPAPFPRKLAYNLIACYTEPNSVILDPFAGAFTTAVATNDIGGGRKYVCIEIDPDRYEKGVARIRGNNQESLF